MKKAKEYQRILKYASSDSREVSIERIIKQAQKDAIEHTLKVAADNRVKIITSNNPWEMYPNGLADDTYSHNYVEETYSYADKNSILLLKDELFKELEDEST